MTARDDLDRLLLDLAARGQRPPCGQPWAEGLWLSDDVSDRSEAARLCARCVVLEPCARAADEADERHHVWGGQDRTRHHGPKKNPTKKEQHMSETEPEGVDRLAAGIDAREKDRTRDHRDDPEAHEIGAELSRRVATTKENNR